MRYMKLSTTTVLAAVFILSLFVFYSDMYTGGLIFIACGGSLVGFLLSLKPAQTTRRNEDEWHKGADL